MIKHLIFTSITTFAIFTPYVLAQGLYDSDHYLKRQLQQQKNYQRGNDDFGVGGNNKPTPKAKPRSGYNGHGYRNNNTKARKGTVPSVRNNGNNKHTDVFGLGSGNFAGTGRR